MGVLYRVGDNTTSVCWDLKRKVQGTKSQDPTHPPKVIDNHGKGPLENWTGTSHDEGRKCFLRTKIRKPDGVEIR